MNGLTDLGKRKIRGQPQNEESRVLINWVNTFNNPHCILASSSLDFKDGIIFCEIMSSYYQKPLPGVVKDGPNMLEKSLNNISLALNAIKVAPFPEISNTVSKFTAQKVYNNEELVFELLKCMRKLFAATSLRQPPPRSVPFSIETPSKQETAKFPIHPASIQRTPFSDSPMLSPPTCNNKKTMRTPSECQLSSSRFTQNCSPFQRLSKRDSSKRPLRIIRTDVRTKHRVVNWLQEIGLIRPKSVSIAEFPSYCRNGVLLSDLISQLEGRQCTLKGIERRPRTEIVILNNIKKCLEHLRRYEKINFRYLWASEYIINGNADVIYGLLDDLWYFYHNKLSPNDPSQTQRETENLERKSEFEQAQYRSPSPFKKKGSISQEYETPKSVNRLRSASVQSTGLGQQIQATLARDSSFRDSDRRAARSYSQIHSTNRSLQQSRSSSRKRERSTCSKYLSQSYNYY